MTVEDLQNQAPSTGRGARHAKRRAIRQTSVVTARLARDGSGNTPQRSIRIPDDEWEAAKAAADDRGETLSDVIRMALKRYTARHAKQAGKNGAE
jgi:hypothetical protein